MDEYHRFTCSLAIEAGEYLRQQALARASRRGQPQYDLELTVKENAADLVTKVDLHAEKMIMDSIKKKYPKHKIIGEESYSAGQDRRFLLDDEPTWIIDPLDGTVNFVHQFSTFCVSISLCVGGKPIAGAIFAPLLGGLHPTNASGTLYSAAKGLGAWSTPVSFPFDPKVLEKPNSSDNFNPDYPPEEGKPTPFHHAVPLPYLLPSPLPPDAPKGCLLAAEWGKARADGPESNLTKKVNTLWNFAAAVGGRGGKGGMVHGIRSLGSAALDMAYVATGAIDIAMESGPWEWDVAAGFIIVEESGGIMAPSQPPDDWKEGDDIPEANLGSRLYLAIRGCIGTEGESAREAQDRVVREVWNRVEKTDYVRPMM